jgi:alpha-2-macroglobulin
MSMRTNILRPRFIIAGIVALAVVVAGVFAAPLALTGPAVVSVTPPDGEQAFNPQAPIRIVFSQPVAATAR